MAKEALPAGKDVFVEKPLALKVEEGIELVQLAEEKDKILMVGHLLEYHPAVVKLKELIDKGELGRIQYIYSNRLNLGKFRTEENILWSFAPHDISVTLLLLGGEMPQEVSAHGGYYLHQDIADVTLTTMNFKEGIRAHIFVSWLHLNQNGWYLARTKGDHRQYKHSFKTSLVTIAGHLNDDIAKGTLKSVLKQAGLKEGEKDA